MQLKKLRRRLSRDVLVDVGTPRNPNLVPKWAIGKPPEEAAAQLRSRQLNPNDTLYVSRT